MKETMRSGIDTKDLIDEEKKVNSLLKPLKEMEEYYKVYNENTEFFSTYNPDMIEKTLLDTLKA